MHRKIWVVGFPKSGNTWLSYLLSYIFNTPFLDYDAPHKVPKNPTVRTLVDGSNKWEDKNNFVQLCKTHQLPHETNVKSDDLVVYILRDPRDTFVSYSYYSTHLSEWKGRLWFRFLGLFGRQTQISWFIKKWINHVKKWDTRSDISITYEGLLSGSSYLSEKLSNRNLDVSSQIINNGIDNFAFDKLSGGRTQGSEDSKSFFRKGVSGDWVNFLTEKEEESFRKVLDFYHKF